MTFLSELKKILQLFLITILLWSCQKYNHPVPDVPVEKSININLPLYTSLQGVSGWIYIDGGSRGILVYRASLDEFVAFDRHGTYNAYEECDPVYVDSNNVLNVIDPCSASTYSILDGTVTNGPAEYPLKQYKTQFSSGTNQLRIYN